MSYSSIVDSIEIHENERAWIGGGFSKRGLLPNDCGRYSTTDGSLSFKTLEEAQDALLLPGYSYLDNSSFVQPEEDPPWYYARDFSRSAMEHKALKRGPLHWVRFRRLVRPIRLNPASLFLAEDGERLQETLKKCSFADSQATEQLSNTLVEVMAYLSLLENPNRLTEAAAILAKCKVLEILGQKDATFRLRNKIPQARLAALRRELERVANAERDKPQHLLSKVEFYNSCQRNPQWKDRCQQISRSYFSECKVVAGWMVRLLDEPEFLFHCNEVDCDTSCQFFHVSCYNQGCSAVLSQKYLTEHDNVCDYKIISCPCGESIQRLALKRHCQEECPLREESCPFHKIGCVRICQAHELPDHMETHVGSHLLLALDRMMEFQNVIRDLNKKVTALQEENQQLQRRLQVYHEASVKEANDIQRKVTDVGKKLSNLENSSRKEFKKIKDHANNNGK